MILRTLLNTELIESSDNQQWHPIPTKIPGSSADILNVHITITNNTSTR